MKPIAAAFLLAPMIAAPAMAASPKALPASNRQVQVVPAPAWVVPPPTPTEQADLPTAAMRFVYVDNQAFAGPAGLESYSAYRIRLLKPEALALGTITLSWLPDAGSARLHALRLIRDGKVTDLTANAKFEVIQRESNLEASMLDGRLTAVYQVPGLQVGDEIEIAQTVTIKDPTLPEHRSGLAILPQGGVPGAFRTRIAWPEGAAIRWQATKDVEVAEPSLVGANRVLSVELRDPAAPEEPVVGAPPRYSIHRLIEFTDFARWPELSARLWPLYDKTSRPAPGSPILAEAAKIAAATSDPTRRAEMALRLVQDRIRYVYVGLDTGNMTPASVDETWTRRFADCKGKTVLLIAILRELGIAAEPMLVNSNGGDGLSLRLPNPGLFDHVIVRATIAGKPWLLDGTRLGDRALDLLPVGAWREGLPLREGGGELEKLPTPSPVHPQAVNLLDIDATAGIDQPALVTARRILRGNDAASLAAWFATVPADQAQRAIKEYWRGEEPWIEGDKASWKLDEDSGILTLTLTGEGELGDPDEAKTENGSVDVPASGLTAPSRLRRPRSQDQTLPWVTAYPSFNCWATTLRLPPPPANQRWDLSGEPFDKLMGGVGYWRRLSLADNVVRTVMSRRFQVPEISAAQATELNGQLASYDGSAATLSLRQTFKGAAKWPQQPQPFSDATDWTQGGTPCAPAQNAKPSAAGQ